MLKPMVEEEKNRIITLELDEGTIKGDENLKKYITDFYKKLFGHPEEVTIALGLPDAPKISKNQTRALTRPFSMEELHREVCSMVHNKSPGPDGFPIEFYQRFWELRKWDFKKLLDHFHDGRMDIFRLNYGIITLVPKTKDAKQI